MTTAFPEPELLLSVPARSKSRPARRGTPEAALREIPDGSRVVIPPLSGTPLGLLAELDRLRDGWTDLELASGLLLEPIAPLDHPGDPFRFSTYQTSGAYRPAEAAGVLGHIPTFYVQLSELFEPGSALPADAVLVQVSPPNKQGNYSLANSVGGILDAIRTAPLVIAQVNPRVPYTYGASELLAEDFDWLVDLDGRIPEVNRAQPGPIEHQIAEHVVSLIPDGATLQFGIGAVPEAIMGLLSSRADLGIHSGLFSDGLIDLLASGAITGARKGTARDVIVVTEAIGTANLYHWLDYNKHVLFAPASYTHSPIVLSQQHQLVAINSAIEVALDGTVNAETVRGRRISGSRGQADFAASAVIHGGLNVIALPSTAARGRVSRIVKELPPGAAVTTPSFFADIIVTEHSAVQLRGRTLGQRAAALRAIAHPDFRSELGSRLVPLTCNRQLRQ